MRAHTVVVGAGPAGLAAAAMLRREGLTALVVEREADLGASWRNRYDSLRLHTVRSLSSRPGMRLPRSLGRFVGRDAFVEYLERYAARHHVAVQAGTHVSRIDRSPAGFRLRAGDGDIEAAAVVVATGHQHTPMVPAWPGRDGYPGRRVLVVGTGNSGADIAVELVRGGAGEVGVSMRHPPHIIRGRRSACPPSWPAWCFGMRRRPRPIRWCDLHAGGWSGICAASGCPRRPRACSPTIAAPAPSRSWTPDSWRPCAAGAFASSRRWRRSRRRGCGSRTAPRSPPTRSSPRPDSRPALARWSATWTSSTRAGARASTAATAARSCRACGSRATANPISGALRELRREAPAVARAIGTVGP